MWRNILNNNLKLSRSSAWDDGLDDVISPPLRLCHNTSHKAQESITGYCSTLLEPNSTIVHDLDSRVCKVILLERSTICINKILFRIDSPTRNRMTHTKRDICLTD